MNNQIKFLQEWYHFQCDGYWEHAYGITIETLDNPGWSVSVELEGTPLSSRSFDPVEIKRSDTNWYYCDIKNNIFRGAGGPFNLENILTVFQEFVNSHRDGPTDNSSS